MDEKDQIENPAPPAAQAPLPPVSDDRDATIKELEQIIEEQRSTIHRQSGFIARIQDRVSILEQAGMPRASVSGDPTDDGTNFQGLATTLKVHREHHAKQQHVVYPKTLVNASGSETTVNSVAEEVEARGEGYRQQGETV